MAPVRNRAISTLLVATGIATCALAMAPASSSAAPPGLSAADVALVRKVAGHSLSAHGRVRAVHVKGRQAIDSLTPGEEPWGVHTAEVAAMDVLVVQATGPNLAKLSVFGPPGNSIGDSQPLGFIAIINAQTGESLGGATYYTQAALAKSDLTPLINSAPGAPQADVDVDPLSDGQ
jgi:hypothetical protein